ncbi:hypothetical protein EON35_15220 [Listeria monocytogenes]|uniref:Uncharacterized protein n=1 Tax=Listeria monocytogenes TaxID=1639 RepID=A0A5L0VL77_LISMN|nr:MULTISPECIES: hypothetical protein [Listeria]EAE3716067.1 hypothetical protein [Listeria monocytogenes serotype 1/2c]AMD25933.1 hypothetical protein CG42_15045 [Listeria monocytogenes]EAA0052270.1 hypothetical protein [Listeria monocytogenes]EAC2439841.1 hypothetical protein [Listeria monocytogenes]EAC2641971.1 hypothetical protein [Listeria monocytogenes]
MQVVQGLFHFVDWIVEGIMQVGMIILALLGKGCLTFLHFLGDQFQASSNGTKFIYAIAIAVTILIILYFTWHILLMSAFVLAIVIPLFLFVGKIAVSILLGATVIFVVRWLVVTAKNVYQTKIAQ